MSRGVITWYFFPHDLKQELDYQVNIMFISVDSARGTRD